jgi:hypothetical protein
MDLYVFSIPTEKLHVVIHLQLILEKLLEAEIIYSGRSVIFNVNCSWTLAMFTPSPVTGRLCK